MVIGRRFAWAHLPKTGGDATYLMLARVPGLVQFADPLEDNDKHMPFFGREAEVRGRLLAMNMRRLPAWAVSAAHHRARYGLHPEFQPLPLQSPAEIAEQTDPDDLLRWMTDHGRFAVDRWLRTERLAEDVLSLLDELGELTPSIPRAVLAVGQVNVGPYRSSPHEQLSPAQMARLYELNPAWSEIERRVYGNLLVPSDLGSSADAEPLAQRPAPPA